MENEFLDIDNRNAWASVFQEIKNESNNFSYIIKDAKKLENKTLNRYRDVNPYDHSRVRLQRGDKDYINASLVEVPQADRSYILTQGPLPITTGHFWLMVWEQKTRAILMLNRIIEKNAVKCHQYWPSGKEFGGEEDKILTDVDLKISFVSQKDKSNYILREFLITDLQTEEFRSVLQFHYTTWPDFGVPESPAAFLNFLFAVRELGALNLNVGPPVVHCSAGIGRSGTFCLVDSCLVLIEKKNDLNAVNVRKLLLEMRHYRMGLIQTPDQLRFSYLAIIEGAKLLLSQTESSNVPFNHVNMSQALDERFDLPDSKLTEMGYNEDRPSSDAFPPPLPPRIGLSSDDSSPDCVCSTLGRDCSECNGNINKPEDFFSKSETIRHTKLERCSCRASTVQELSSEQSLTESNSKADTSSGCIRTGSSSEIRKRARKEREEKTAALVQDIKKKQKEAELYGKRRLKKKRRE